MLRSRPPTLLLVASVILGGAACVVGRPDAETARPPVLRTGDVPIGGLGHPLGEYLTIEGVRLDAAKTGVSTLQVDIVNGQKVPVPVNIWIDNLDLPKENRCKIKGYETVRMVGKPPAEADAAKEKGERSVQPQAGWQAQLFFVALSVIEPEGLRITPRRP